MGFRYNQHRQAQLQHSSYQYDRLGGYHKVVSKSDNRLISRTNVKPSRHRLSAEDRAFLQFIGLKLRNKY